MSCELKARTSRSWSSFLYEFCWIMIIVGISAKVTCRKKHSLSDLLLSIFDLDTLGKCSEIFASKVQYSLNGALVLYQMNCANKNIPKIEAAQKTIA